MTIKVLPTKQIQNSNIKAYSPEGECIGIIHNELQLDYLLSQIAIEQAEGYYVVSKGLKYTISKDGRIPFGNNITFKHSLDDMLRAIFGF